jgi:hypothetical protein
MSHGRAYTLNTYLEAQNQLMLTKKKMAPMTSKRQKLLDSDIHTIRTE